MPTKLLLSFAVATFIAALASVWVLSEVRERVGALERSRTSTGPASPAAPSPGPAPAPAAAPAPTSPPSGAFPAARPADVPPSGEEGDPLASRDPLVKLDHLIRKTGQISDDSYDYVNDITGDLMALKREVRQLKTMLKAVLQGLAGGRQGALGIGWGLPPRGAPLDGETVKRFVEEASRHGITVEQGRVTAKALLNLSPNRQMPIEYFITRFPESGHETLVHLIGSRTLDDLAKDPVGGLRGLGTALYKALRAAGFAEGEGSRPDPASPDPRNPRWLLPTGDVVYLYVRYELGGAHHLARATDWVIDPSTGTVLPEDAFRFTGSLRGEDPDLGDEVLAAELGGLLVSVWPNARALLEVALDSAEHNDYQYNGPRIPKPSGEGPLLLELVFSKTPLPPEGDGALPLAPPAKPEPLPPPPGPKPADEPEAGPR